MVKNIEINLTRVQAISRKVHGLIMKKSRDPVEGLYALKACLYVMRSAMKSAGIFLDNEAELDAMLTESIDEELRVE